MLSAYTKALSDTVVSSTIVLIGVADSVGELIREHRSVERALLQIQMPRMSTSDLTEGITAAGMTIADAAVARIAALSQGLPHYTHLLTQLAAQAALAERRAEVGVRRSGGAGAMRYRFVNPLLQHYVAMRGISEGVLRASDLRSLR